MWNACPRARPVASWTRNNQLSFFSFKLHIMRFRKARDAKPRRRPLMPDSAAPRLGFANGKAETGCVSVPRQQFSRLWQRVTNVLLILTGLLSSQHMFLESLDYHARVRQETFSQEKSWLCMRTLQVSGEACLKLPMAVQRVTCKYALCPLCPPFRPFQFRVTPLAQDPNI